MSASNTIRMQKSYVNTRQAFQSSTYRCFCPSVDDDEKRGKIPVIIFVIFSKRKINRGHFRKKDEREVKIYKYKNWVSLKTCGQAAFIKL